MIPARRGEWGRLVLICGSSWGFYGLAELGLGVPGSAEPQLGEDGSDGFFR